MFKLVGLFVVFVCVNARPGYFHGHHLEAPLIVSSPIVHHQEYVKLHEPVIAKVGHIVESIPSSVSHQSSSVVHSHAHIVKPVIVPAVKTYVSPVIKSYVAAPHVHSYHSAPLLLDYHHGHHYHH